jgi:hypothetical protein
VIGAIDPTSGPYTIYTATVDNTSTALWSCALGLSPSPCNNAPITVGTPPTAPQCTGSGCGSGVSNYCTIKSDAPDYYVRCGEPNNLKPCSSNVIWQFPGITTCVGVTTCTVPLSSTGDLVAIVDPSGDSCTLHISGSAVYQCLEYS